MITPVVAVLSGGVSGEREVSQRSAKAVYEALRHEFSAQLYEVESEALPVGLDPSEHVIFNALHGVFGEDGGMQALLEEAGFSYTGSDAASSRLCMDKTETKDTARSAGVRLVPGVTFEAGRTPPADKLVAEFGGSLVLKPNGEGSSIGVQFVEGEADLRQAMDAVPKGRWIVEKLVSGRELTVGILNGRALGAVEIVPQSGRYDYASKYTKGLTEFRWPAELPPHVMDEIRFAAETVFLHCGCRDFARVDFILSKDEEPFFLEINTIPGLTETSLLPKSAQCEGMDFRTLAMELVAPAISRFRKNRIVT